jgi:hypothetical protein
MPLPSGPFSIRVSPFELHHFFRHVHQIVQVRSRPITGANVNVNRVIEQRMV